MAENAVAVSSQLSNDPITTEIISVVSLNVREVVMKINQILIIAIIAAGLSGCANSGQQPTLVMLQNPQTKEIVKCDDDIYAKTKTCAEAYEKGGWVRLGAYVPKF